MCYSHPWASPLHWAWSSWVPRAKLPTRCIGVLKPPNSSINCHLMFMNALNGTYYASFYKILDTCYIMSQSIEFMNNSFSDTLWFIGNLKKDWVDFYHLLRSPLMHWLVQFYIVKYMFIFTMFSSKHSSLHSLKFSQYISLNIKQSPLMFLLRPSTLAKWTLYTTICMRRSTKEGGTGVWSWLIACLEKAH